MFNESADYLMGGWKEIPDEVQRWMGDEESF